MLGGVAEGSREDREQRTGPAQNAAMRCRPETPKTNRCAVARKETMRCRFAANGESTLRLQGQRAAVGDAPPDRRAGGTRRGRLIRCLTFGRWFAFLFSSPFTSIHDRTRNHSIDH